MTTEQQSVIYELLKRIEIINGVKTIDGDVNLDNFGLTKLPNLSDVCINGLFDCCNNKLTSLLGCPNTVNGLFDCCNNKLTSLQYCPNTIGGGFDCGYNQLTSLKHCPDHINGPFYCGSNQLTSLQYCPNTLNGEFCCSNNNIASFKYAPSNILGAFYGNNNPFTKSLDLPIKVSKEVYLDLIADFNEEQIQKAYLNYLKANPIQIISIDMDI